MRIADAFTCSGGTRADREVLLARLVGKSRSWLLANDDQHLSEDQETRFLTWVNRRGRGEPVAYITGMQEFYGREFQVTPDTLIPRPSTEGLVSLALRCIDGVCDDSVVEKIDTHIVGVVMKRKIAPQPRVIVDVGTGCGCIGITLALERPDAVVLVTDVSTNALDVARSNAALFRVLERLHVRQGSLLESCKNLREPFFLISNPPYVIAGTSLEPDVLQFEPSHALFAGEEGIDVLQPLSRAAVEHPYCVGYAVECLADQVTKLATFP